MRIPYRPAQNLRTGGVGERVSGTVLAQSASRSLPVWKGLGDVAEAFGIHATKMQDRQNEHDILEAQSEQANILAGFKNANLANQDPKSLLENFNTTVIPKLQSTVNSEYSPVVQEHLKKNTNGLINQHKIKTAERAALMQIEQTRGLSQNNVQGYLDNGMYEDAKIEIERGMSSGIYSPHKGEELLMGIDQAESNAFFSNAIERDPHDLVDKLENGDYIKSGDLSEEQNYKMIKRARAKQASVNRDITDSISDAIYLDDIESVGDLRGFDGFDKLSETNQRKIEKSFLDRLEKEKYDLEKARSNAPKTEAEKAQYMEDQKVLASEVSLLINDYDTRNLDDTDEYVEIQNMLNGIENKAVRERYKSRLKRKLDEEITGRKSKLDAGKNILNNFHSTALKNIKKPEGKVVKHTLRSRLEDGFFDEDNLRRGGISDKDIEYINKAEEQIRENETIFDESASTIEAKLVRLKKVWLRKRENVEATGEELELFQAAFKSKEGELDKVFSESTEYEDGEFEAYEKRRTQVLLENNKVEEEYEDWVKDNPNADSKAHNEKLIELNHLLEGSINSSYDLPSPARSDAFDPYEFTFNAEAQYDSRGNLAVYAPPEGDGGGSFEVAGITQRWQEEDAKRIKSLVQRGEYSQAKRASKEYYKKIAAPYVKHTENKGLKLQIGDTTHHRGATGLRKILQRATGLSTTNHETLIKELSARPNSLILFNNARVSYEAEEIDNPNREKFRKGLINRFKNAHNAALKANKR